MHGADRSEQFATGCRDAAEDCRGSGRATGSFLAEQNKFQTLLRELLEAQRSRKSEQLSKEQLALFEAAWKARSTDESAAGEDDDDLDGDAGAGPKANEAPNPKRGGRQSLARHLKR